MKIEQQIVKIREVVNGFEDNGNEGVVGYEGKLDIRPAFQREFVYKDKQRNAVIDSILKGYPLNVFYWVKRKDKFEVLDGQQRTISICRFVEGRFSIQIGQRDYYFHSLSNEEQERILDYELTVYYCEGTDRETLDWFEIVNLSGEPLTPQELRNAVYGGPWVESAKRYFSKPGSTADGVGGKYMTGRPLRQDYLQTVIDWYSDGEISKFMTAHQFDSDAGELWEYFNAVIEWIEFVFPTYHKSMQGVNWGKLYREYQHDYGIPKENDREVLKLVKDDDVTDNKGIYEYILSGDEHLLNIRQFSDGQKEAKYAEQEGICVKCGEEFALGEMHGDHIDPWSEGGKTEIDNLQMLCKPCNRRKGAK